MTKQEMIDLISKETELTVDQVQKAYGSILNAITSELMEGNPVRLSGFGTFQVAERKARTGRNPQTGETIEIPAHKVVQFKASSNLKENI